MLRKDRRGKKQRCLILVTVLLAGVSVLVYLLQHSWAHRGEPFLPKYSREVLTEESDYETFFRQTGLGKSAVDKLLAEGNFQKILEVQEAFWQPAEVSCEPVLGWFTREDRLVSEEGAELVEGPELIDLQPGDILLTLSTHSLGWRHGHAALVIDEDTTLECAVLGTDSCYGDTEYWRRLSQYLVLRVKDVTPEMQQEVVAYACSELYGVPYHLTAGFIGPKAPDPDSAYFGLQCSYLVWYAWNHLGYDIDSDGGRLVTSTDILQSDLLEVVQVYGMER